MVLRWQPVLPLLLMVCRLKPPTNEPQGILPALSRSPMFLAVIWTWTDGLEQTSPAGSISPMSVKLPSLFGTPASADSRSWPIAEVDVPGGTPTGSVKPLVVPANMWIAPGVDGPKVSVQA